MAEEVTAEVAQEEMTAAAEAVGESAVEEPPAAVEESAEPLEQPEEEAASVTAIETILGRDYELIYILEPTVDEAQIQEINGRVRSVIESGGGAIENMRVSELRRLAYPIKKRSEGLYVVINARCEPAPMREVDRVLKLEERVLRHMILRVDEI